MGNNGVLKIERKGRATFQIGEGKPFDLDVIEVYNTKIELGNRFRDDKGEIPPENTTPYNEACREMVMQLAGEGAPNDLTMTEVLEFDKLLTEKAKELKGFFTIKSDKEPSSQESTAVTFSQ